MRLAPSKFLTLAVSSVLVFASACQLPVETAVESAIPVKSYAAVASPDKFGTQVGVEILNRGGNAVDAAVATAFALAVTYPEAGNIGGGGFMLIHHNGKANFLDYREQAPGTAYRDMFLDGEGNVIPDLSLVGHKAAGVPGTVAGLWEAHQNYGSLAWADLVAPAIELAKGHELPQLLYQRFQEEIEELEGRTNFADYYGDFKPGELLVQTELAETLERIQTLGRDGFYKHETADFIVAEMQRGAGLISHQDLVTYEPRWREPLQMTWRDYRLITAPLPSSGGFALVQLLKMKDHLSKDFMGHAHNSAQYVHLIAEMEKRVFADRAQYLGDPDFVDAPTSRLVDERYIRRRAEEVKIDEISQLDSVSPGLEGSSTTHFSIVDFDGNAVANTYTLNTWFGAKTVVEGAGFLLNNEMDDFSAKPGAPNFYGVVGNEANAIEPGKRMLSSMTPTILLREDRPAMVVGSPGGSTIFTSVFQAVVNVLDFNMTAQEAVSVSRFHHQLLPPTEVTFSVCCPLSQATQSELKVKGYDPRPHAWEFGDLQLIWLNESGHWELGSDPRGRGTNRLVEKE